MARTVSAFLYQEPASLLVGRFKYQACLQHGRVLGDMLAAELATQYRGQALPSLLVPVPLHITRLRERGFNQALVLARQLGATLGIPVAADLVERVRQTPPQQGLSAKERRRNLRGAFELKPGAHAGCRSVALVDDVVTTMSTVYELARVLRHHGAHDVHVWCLARA